MWTIQDWLLPLSGKQTWVDCFAAVLKISIDFSYVHGSWMSSCLVCRCFGRGELDSMISGWVRAPCLSPESSDVTHQVQQFQGQWMAINPKDVFKIYIYIYTHMRKGFPVYTRLYHSIHLMMSFHLYPAHWEPKWMAQSPDIQALLQGGFRLQGPVVWKLFGFPDWGQWSKPMGKWW